MPLHRFPRLFKRYTVRSAAWICSAIALFQAALSPWSIYPLWMSLPEGLVAGLLLAIVVGGVFAMLDSIGPE
jgi:hypothetical protein